MLSVLSYIIATATAIVIAMLILCWISTSKLFVKIYLDRIGDMMFAIQSYNYLDEDEENEELE